MRKIIGCAFMLAGVAEAFLFTAWGTAHGAQAGQSPWWAFGSLGANYPYDVGYLAFAAWFLGLGLYFVLTDVAPQTVGGKLAPRPEPRGGPVSKLFLVNAFLLATSLLCAYVGAKADVAGPFLAIFAIAAAAQVAVGLIMLVLAIFEKPKTIPAMILGMAAYLAGSAGAVVVFLFGQAK